MLCPYHREFNEDSYSGYRNSMKHCYLCSQDKEDSSFYDRAIVCKPCHNKRGRVWAQNNKDKVSNYAYKGRIRRQYNLSEEEYKVLYEKQKGACKICSLVPNKKRLHVDHCHSTGNVRGLLCENCNRGLGMFKDNINLLKSAQDYLS